jgi:hypothetical protein
VEVLGKFIPPSTRKISLVGFTAKNLLDHFDCKSRRGLKELSIYVSKKNSEEMELFRKKCLKVDLNVSIEYY